MFASVASATVLGARGHLVNVEVHVSGGLPSFTIVGLPDEACRESRDRVRAALLSSSLAWPTRRVTVNLAPTQQRKSGSSLDLAIALGVLVASDELPAATLAGLGFVGELGLDGSLRRLSGVVPLVAALGDRCVIVPRGCEAETAVVTSNWRSVGDLSELIAALKGLRPWPEPGPRAAMAKLVPGPDLADVKGQHEARLAAELAAAGGHHLLLFGPPGAGKTMVAERVPGLLPDLEHDDALEATMIHSAAGVALPPSGLVVRPPFRAPHHTSSLVSLIGGGTANMRPGEVSLASGGVLFLDELAEFPAAVLDGLRQPLEDRVVRVSRARATVVFPARFLLVAATNPCPCGMGGVPGACLCEPAARQKYARRISGPLLDRFDLRIHVHRVDLQQLLNRSVAESSATVVKRVVAAREIAKSRGVRCNAELSVAEMELHAELSTKARTLLVAAVERGRLSGRGLQRIRRTARTIDDLEQREGPLTEEAVAAAMSMRAGVLTSDRAA